MDEIDKNRGAATGQNREKQGNVARKLITGFRIKYGMTSGDSEAPSPCPLPSRERDYYTGLSRRTASFRMEGSGMGGKRYTVGLGVE